MRVNRSVPGPWWALPCLLLVWLAACSRTPPEPPARTCATPDEAVEALAQAVEGGSLDEVAAIFGSGSQTLIDSSDSVTARRNREVFTIAMGETWRLESPDAATRTLVIGYEAWPFPIPIVQEGNRWRFDAEAGAEEIVARRIGRNELAVIRICYTYVSAQILYARSGHDGRPAGLYAKAFGSEPGRQNGLYWPAGPGEKHSPLGDLVAAAAAEGRRIGGGGAEPAPFHGYYFRILTAQGAAAPGGARSYLENGELAGGFALVAWPAQYDVTGVMTFTVNQDGVIREKNLGPETDLAARGMSVYDPDDSWSVVR